MDIRHRIAQELDPAFNPPVPLWTRQMEEIKVTIVYERGRHEGHEPGVLWEDVRIALADLHLVVADCDQLTVLANLEQLHWDTPTQFTITFKIMTEEARTIQRHAELAAAKAAAGGAKVLDINGGKLSAKQKQAARRAARERATQEEV